MATAEIIQRLRTNLLARMDAIGKLLADLEAVDSCGQYTNPGAKPNVKSSDGGLTVDHHQYKMGLYKELDELEKRLLKLNDLEDAMDPTANDPFELHTETWPL